MNQLRRVQVLAYPTEASRSADVKTVEIAGKEPGVPTCSSIAGRDTVGDSWRTLPMPTARPGVEQARFYFASRMLNAPVTA